jgi:aspartate carbamoyltransferase regulatory subunit
VIEKIRVERPERVTGVIDCPNHNCITNAEEPVRSAFEVVDDGVRCEYCDEIVREDFGEWLSVT